MVERAHDLPHAAHPSAGRGLRFLPATTAIPTPMLPVTGHPFIDDIRHDVAAAGNDQIRCMTRALEG